SYQKQIIGRQEQAGVFDFMGHTFFDASLGESALEPIQLAVRSVIERAVLEMMTKLYRIPPEACASPLGGPGDPLAGPGDPPPAGASASAPPGDPPPPPNAIASATPATVEEKHHDKAHDDPYRWYSSSDPATEPGLRTGVE
ncbi:MAG: CsgG/HfaB family protein, partial [Rhizomicrobium sp.]